MARTYKKNAQNIYVLPFYARFLFWWLVAFGIALGVTWLSSLSWFSVEFWWLVGVWSPVVLLSIWRAYSLTKSVIKAKTIGRYITQRRAEKAIQKSLLETMTVNRLQNTPFVLVPGVTVGDSRPSHLTVEVEKLAGMYDIERMSEDINSSLRGSLGGYAVTSSMVSSDGLMYRFVLEDVVVDKTWRPATFEDIKVEPYFLTLQEGLTVNLAERAHIAVWGKTGSKKTTVLLGMILQLFAMGADVRFVDGKDEFSAFEVFYPSEKIVSEVDEVLRQIDDILQIVKKRQKIMAAEMKKRNKMGLKASDVGFSPVALVADEIGSIVALMDAKQAKRFINGLVAIIQRGRSVGVSVIVSTQDPSVDTLPQKIRQQFSTKILLGSANSDIQRMAFGEVATVGDVEDFRGFYTCDSLTNQPMKYFVCDLWSHRFNELKKIEKAYKVGQKEVFYGKF